ncbi:MAG: CehA/McbA family metallohydrolase [Planctomycetes bacterium]|nr:CehA/McbA family metallohydrolase [Planctomycetota bacterium]
MIRIEHPYHDLAGGRWLRGNLHAHTLRSDGERGPDEVIADYARRGYDFLAITDHDITTTAEECAAWTAAHGLVLIPGNEVTAGGPHLLHVGAARHVEAHTDRQAVIDRIAGGDGNAGGFVVVNHPSSHANFDQCPIALMRAWTGYTGIEIFNGVAGRADGSDYALNKWDMLLAEGRRVWGFANDDAHAAEGDVELGWNVVNTPSCTPEAIVAALRAGRFYASTGVTIEAVHVGDDTIRIETRDAQRINALMNTGRRFARSDGRAIQVRVPADATYVRFECWGAGESFAWTQPFFVTRS